MDKEQAKGFVTDIVKETVTEEVKSLVTVETYETEIKALKETIEKLEKSPGLNITAGEEKVENYLGKQMSIQFKDFEISGKKLINIDKIYSLAKESVDLATVLSDTKLTSKNAQLAHQSILEREQKVALNETTAAQGGYYVSPEYMEELVALARLSSVALTGCRVLTTGVKDLYLPTEDGATGVTVAWIDEAGAVGQSEPTVGQVHLTQKKLGAYAMMSTELLQDTWFDISSWLLALMGEAIGQEVDNQTFNGTGSPFTGIMGNEAVTKYLGKASNSGKTSIADIVATDFSQCNLGVAANRTVGAKWYMHREIFNYVVDLVDTTGQPIYKKLTDPMSYGINGYPVELVEVMPKVSDDAADTNFIVFGNLGYYYIARHATGMRADLDPYGRFLNDQVRVRYLTRLACAMAHSGAFVGLKTSAT